MKTLGPTGSTLPSACALWDTIIIATCLMRKTNREVPLVAMDYMFMTERQKKEEETGNPILAMQDETLKMIWAHVVPSKGRDKYAIERVSHNLDYLDTGG